MKDVLYCDGGIVASNPTGIAIHEAKTLFPDVPIELVGKLEYKVCISFKVKFRVTNNFKLQKFQLEPEVLPKRDFLQNSVGMPLLGRLSIAPAMVSVFIMY